MARFRATIHGQRGKASRLGSKSSGMWATIHGWNVGVTVIAFVDADGRDMIRVLKDGGSNGVGQLQEIAVIKEGV